jgi:hypothetical protein
VCVDAQHRAARGVNIYICICIYIYIYMKHRAARGVEVSRGCKPPVTLDGNTDVNSLDTSTPCMRAESMYLCRSFISFTQVRS